MWGCRPGSWPDPRYDWPGCLWADLSATDLGRCVLPPVRWACPDRGLAATRHHHSPDRPAGPTTAATRPEPIRRQAHDQHAASRPVQPGRCRRHRGDPGGRYPQGHPRGRGAQLRGCAAGQPLLCSYRRWLPAAARLGAGVRDAAAGRGGVHRLVRRGAEPPLAGRRRAGPRRQPAGQGHPAPTRQDRRHRRRSRRPSGACWSGDRDGQDRRRAGGDGSAVQARQGLCDQVPHPGDQPAEGRAGGRRPSAARVAVWAEQPGTHPPMRAAGPCRAHRRHQRRGLDPAAAGAPDPVPYPGDRRPQRQNHRGGDRPHPTAA